MTESPDANAGFDARKVVSGDQTATAGRVSETRRDRECHDR